MVLRAPTKIKRSSGWNSVGNRVKETGADFYEYLD
jgi:hypothetical protein